MKRTRIVTLLCLIAGIANAQQNMRGSDTLALYTRGLITDLGLGSQLNYLGGGSGLGIADAINSRTTGQTVNPASRAVNANEVNAAAANNLQFVDYVLGLDGIVITVNDVGNANLTVNPPTPLVRFSEAAVRDLSYQFSRQLHMYKVIGITDGYGPTGAQAALLTGAQNCGCNCPRLAANGFFSVTADYCATCTATCP